LAAPDGALFAAVAPAEPVVAVAFEGLSAAGGGLAVDGLPVVAAGAAFEGLSAARAVSVAPDGLPVAAGAAGFLAAFVSPAGALAGAAPEVTSCACSSSAARRRITEIPAITTTTTAISTAPAITPRRRCTVPAA
jgi:hypothetical protein